MDLAASGFWAIAEMVLFLGVAAVGLAVVGVYGVTAFATGRRTKEFGIRMALGAVKVDIIHLVLRTGAKPIAAGLLAGLCLALGAPYALAKLMKNAPFVLDTQDPFAYFGVSLLLVLSSIVAMLIPALRATRANPVHALRKNDFPGHLDGNIIGTRSLDDTARLHMCECTEKHVPAHRGRSGIRLASTLCFISKNAVSGP